MKILYTLLVTLSLTAVTAQAAIQKTSKHTIKKGETLSSIAKKYHTSVAKIRQVNGLKKGAVIQYGKQLNVPVKNYAAAADKTTDYVIKKGDSLSTIAQRHQTTIAKLREANGLQRSAILKIGSVLKVPQTKQEVSQVKQKVQLAKPTQKATDKKFIASLSRLETVNLKKQKEAKSQGFSFSNIFGSKSKEEAEELDKCQAIISLAKQKLGKKYVWGASGNRNTYDCSSFVKFVYKKHGIDLPRTSIMQSKVGKQVKRDELQVGDLIFFDTSKQRKGYVNHVGIYLGDNKFIHASSAKKQVVITSLEKAFYSSRFKGARRHL
ncbi:MAG TPA: LysM peptidoglycan-binding domain-containing protein [Sulfurovum sp.]|uniref:C40 family peptidase n=1 Tax=Sulfurovum sp. TaxID=1969726 RepID=UPI002F945E2D